ncbi:gamma-glutamyl-gamma-aminobutyrate hydrolase family protein [Aquincola sp. MAHUQ-54]|uniref:Gamma-glutamyl-gamma-aminobutyrate hydrolase family protein n=1 Tax=Aquincola agrisoli TaxID=3119538 RepID=A0AAW9QGU3_9BURK
MPDASSRSSPLLIGLSARIYHPTSPVPSLGGVFTRTLHYLEQSVAHWVMSREVLGVMIPAVEREGLVRRTDMSLRNYADMLDGLVLQGGTDVSPETYGEAPMKPQWAGDRVRDLYEMELLDAFITAGKPVLGICRGCQLLNVAFGGSLYQDIPTQLPGALKHHDENTYERQFHRVSLVRGTKLASLYPERTAASINSIHHQSVKELGHDLEVEALAIPDGVVEAIRWKGPSYVFGMQWHPEFMALNQFHDEQLDGTPILDDFLAAVRERKSR